MQASVLSARNLACRRGDRVLFAGLDLTLKAGDALHLVGPNGTGKSSLLQILARLRKPLAGEWGWQGTLGLLDERSALEPDWSLTRALAFWADIDGGQADLAAVGLAGLEHVPVRFLSTGQTKRAALARLLTQNADHWLLDEPLNGLDRDGISLVDRLIANRRASGGAVVIASHQRFDLPGAQVLDLRDYLK